jgi:Tetrahydrofolate dehydrogenase/cyclohydrolase, NAD(P)-binding domain
MLLLGRNATVTYCHSRTRDLPDIVRAADIVVAAVRSANMAADLGFPVSAPGRTRTCDPLLRRPERYSEMLSGENADSNECVIYRDATRQFL